MIVDRDTPPERNLYFVGARIIKLILDNSLRILDFDIAYHTINVGCAEAKQIPFSYFLLALDWLYILGAIDLNDDGDIVRCF